MVLYSYNNEGNGQDGLIKCKSTEELPTDYIDGIKIREGWSALEIDTGELYHFDGENWIDLSGGNR